MTATAPPQPPAGNPAGDPRNQDLDVDMDPDTEHDLDPEQTSRLPTIQRHDEFYSDPTSRLPAEGAHPAAQSNPDTVDPRYATAAGSDRSASSTTDFSVPPVVPAAPPVSRYETAGAPASPSAEVPVAPASAFTEEDDPELPRRRGAGVAGILGIAGVTTAAIGLFALPLQQQPARSEVFFGQLRGAAAYDRVAALTGAESTSLAGGAIATSFWRYGALGIVAGLAVLLALTFAWGPTRRTGGALMLLGGVGSLIYLGIAAPQTNQYVSAVVNGRAVRVDWGDWKIGFWVGAGGIAVTAMAGLLALVSRRR